MSEAPQGGAMTRRERAIATILREEEGSYPVDIELKIEFAVKVQPPPEPVDPSSLLLGGGQGRSVAGRRSRRADNQPSPSPQPPQPVPSEGGPRLKGTNYIHYEFQPMQDPVGLSTRTDLVQHDLHNAPPKVFTDTDSKFAESRDEGGLRWVGWRHSYPLAVNQELLDSVFDDGLRIDVWETKDKVSSRARFDKPKHVPAASDHPGGAPPGGGRLTMRMPKLSVARGHRATPTGRATVVQIGRSSRSSSRSTLAVPNPEAGRRTAPVGHTAAEADRGLSGGIGSFGSEADDARQGLTRAPDESTPNIAARIMAGDVIQKRHGAGSERDAPGTALWVPLTDFFAGETTVVRLIEDASLIGLSKIKQIRITVVLNRPLLSKTFAHKINPLVLTFLQAQNLPNEPVSFPELDRHCKPAAVSFSAFKGAEQRLYTTDKRRDTTQTWNQKHVILTERYSFEELVRFGKEPIEIEVHDRDRLPTSTVSSATLFDSSKDEDFNDFWNAVGTSKTTNVLVDKQKPWDPYGVAKLDLRDLLSGARAMTFELPILAGPRAAPEVSRGGSMHAGHYVERGATLTVGVELFRPFTTAQSKSSFVGNAAPWLKGSRIHRPFGRIVYMDTSAAHQPFFDRLEKYVTETNISALALDQLQLHNPTLALQTYELSDEQAKDFSLDVLTGFQVVMPNARIAVVEGLADKQVAALWELLGHPATPGFRVLYDSSQVFLDRLYGRLGPHLATVHLPETVTELLTRSEIYINGGRGWGCLTGLSQINSLIGTERMEQATRLDLLPSSDSILKVSTSYGGEPAAVAAVETEEPLPAAVDAAVRSGGPVKRRIDSRHTRYMKEKEEGKDAPQPNFMQHNRAAVAERSTINSVEKEELADLNQTVAQASGLVHNYSTQTYNSSVLALEKMQTLLLKDINAGHRPKKMFSYSPAGTFHHSAASAVLMTTAEAPIPGSTARHPDPMDSWTTGKGTASPL